MKELFLFMNIVFFNYAIWQNTNSHIVRNSIYPKDSLVYVNKNIRMVLFIKSNSIVKFKIKNTKTKVIVTGTPNLITVEGKIPEGTNRIDNNDPNDLKGYECETSYQFIGSKIKIAFALERRTRRRLDLTIYDSNLSGLEDGDYTLLNQK